MRNCFFDLKNVFCSLLFSFCGLLSDEETYVNCEGCTGGDKTWCIIKFPDGSTLENKCIEKVADADLSKGHLDCLNGNIYNS